MDPAFQGFAVPGGGAKPAPEVQASDLTVQKLQASGQEIGFMVGAAAVGALMLAAALGPG